MTQTEITLRIAGIGGQGIVLAGYIIGKAAAIYEKKYALFTCQYGPAARGSNCYSSVIISDQPIMYPIIDMASVYICMSANAFASDPLQTVTDGTIFCTDKDAGGALSSGVAKYCSVASTREAQMLGSRLVANMVMLGFVTAATGFICKESMIESIGSSVASQYRALNIRAFHRGVALWLPE